MDPALKYLKIAAKEASKSNEEYKLGAVIVNSGRIIGRGFNTNKSSPRFGSGYHKYLHAEGRAIWDAYRNKQNLIGSTIYIYRKNGLLSRPCKDCQKLIKTFGISRVVYTVEQNFCKEIV